MPNSGVPAYSVIEHFDVLEDADLRVLDTLVPFRAY